MARLVRELNELNEPTVEWESPAVLEQDTEALIEEVLSRHRPKDVSVPASEGAELFPGAVELLRTMRELELRTALVSNTAWRDAESYRRDFVYFGAGDLIDAIVTSLDLKVRKPHDAIFRVATEMAECKAKEVCLHRRFRREGHHACRSTWHALHPCRNRTTSPFNNRGGRHSDLA